MSVIERAARAIYETQGNAVPWDSETLGDWRRDYEREKAKAALDAVNYWGAVAECERLRVFERAFAKVPPEQQARIMSAVRADAGRQ